jgi:hypothetical protein
MFEEMSYTALAGQIVSLIALGFCIVGFASKRDDRLMVLVTNFITIYRLTKMKRRYPEAFEKAKE